MTLIATISTTENLLPTIDKNLEEMKDENNSDTSIESRSDLAESPSEESLSPEFSPPPSGELNVDTFKARNVTKSGLTRFESTKDIHFGKGDYDPYGNDNQDEEENSEDETPSGRIPQSEGAETVTDMVIHSGENGAADDGALDVFKRDRPPAPAPNTSILGKFTSWFTWSWSSKPSPKQPTSVPLKTMTTTGAVATLTTTTTLAVRPKSGLFDFKDNGDMLVDSVEFGTFETKPIQYTYSGEMRTSWDRLKENTVEMLPSPSSPGGPGLVQRLIVKALLSPTRNNLALPTKDQFYRLMTKIPRPLAITFSGSSLDELKLIEEDKERRRRSFRIKQNYFDNNEDFEIRENPDELKVVELKEMSTHYRPRVAMLNT